MYAPHVHRTCTARAPHVHRMCTACAPHVHRMCTAYAPHVHGVCTACAPHDDAPLRPVYAAYTLCVRCVCTACTVHARCVCTARAGGPFRAAAAPRRVLVGRRGTRGGRGARGGARRRRASAASALAQRWPGTYGRATEVQGAVPRRAAAGLLVVYPRRVAHCKLGVCTLIPVHPPYTLHAHCMPQCRSTRSGARRYCAPSHARGGRLCSPPGAGPVAGGSTSERRRSGGQRGACMRRAANA